MSTATTAGSTPRAARRARAARAVSWVLQVLLALLFVVGSAGPKFVGEAYAVQIFAEIGAGQWLRYVVAVLELAGGIGLLVPRLAGVAAIGLVGVMVGATAAQLFLLDTGFWFTPAILAVLLVVVAIVRRDETAALLPRR